MKTMFLIQKYTQYKAAQAEQQKRKVTEKELAQLNHKIDKLLTKLDEHEPEIADSQDDECVVCVNAKATMQTYPCGHRVVCRKCFVKTIQMAVAQRNLPLRCVVCRAKILRLKNSAAVGPLTTSASQYTIGNHWYHVPQSASLYSVSSTMSAASGISAVSSASSCSSASSYKTCASSFSSASLKKRVYQKQGYQQLRTSSPSPSRSPQRRSSGISRSESAKLKERPGVTNDLQGNVHNNSLSNAIPTNATNQNPPTKGKLSLIQEFSREFRNGKAKLEKKGSHGGSSVGLQRNGSGSGSTRLKCARILVNQAQSTCDVGTRPEHQQQHPHQNQGGRSGLHDKMMKPGSAGSATALGGPTIGFRRVTSAPPTSQSCHSFRLSRYDSVAPASYNVFKKGSLQTIPDDPSDAKYE